MTIDQVVATIEGHIRPTPKGQEESHAMLFLYVCTYYFVYLFLEALSAIFWDVHTISPLRHTLSMTSRGVGPSQPPGGHLLLRGYM